jgi:hypothetical protein
MLEQPSGPRIIQRPREHYRIPCDFLWAPRIDISEIDIQSFYCSHQGMGRGIWRGRQVDIHIGCDGAFNYHSIIHDLKGETDGGLRLVERETRGLKAVRGLDLTYEIVAHVFRGDLLIGVLTESTHLSRPIRGVGSYVTSFFLRLIFCRAIVLPCTQPSRGSRGLICSITSLMASACSSTTKEKFA